MTIAYVSSAAAEASSVSMPTHASGDTLVMWAWNTTNSTAVTVPSGWMTVRTRTTGAKYSVLATKIAASASETSGTWTNATHVAVAVYNDGTNYLAIGDVTGQGSTSTTMQYAGEAMQARNGSAWYLGFGAGALNSTAVETPPSGMTHRVGVAGAANGEIAIHDSNGTAATWTSANVTVTSMVWHTIVCEIFDTGIAKKAGGGGYVIGA